LGSLGMGSLQTCNVVTGGAVLAHVEGPKKGSFHSLHPDLRKGATRGCAGYIVSATRDSFDRVCARERLDLALHRRAAFVLYAPGSDKLLFSRTVSCQRRKGRLDSRLHGRWHCPLQQCTPPGNRYPDLTLLAVWCARSARNFRQAISSGARRLEEDARDIARALSRIPALSAHVLSS
jgi:hypothetical protein